MIEPFKNDEERSASLDRLVDSINRRFDSIKNKDPTTWTLMDKFKALNTDVLMITGKRVSTFFLRKDLRDAYIQENEEIAKKYNLKSYDLHEDFYNTHYMGIPILYHNGFSEILYTQTNDENK